MPEARGGTVATVHGQVGSEDRVDHIFYAIDASWPWIIRLLIVATAFLVITPVLLSIVTSLSGSIAFPPTTWTTAAYEHISASTFRAFGTSLRLGILAVIFAMLLAFPAALVLVRSQLPGRTVLEAFFRSPLQVPSVVIGVAFFQFFTLLLNSFDIRLRGEFTGLLAAHVLILTPLMLGIFVARIAAIGRDYEDAAYGLGAGPIRTTIFVLLPLMRPALVAGGIIGFLFSFNEVTASMFLTGANTSTLPVEILGMVQFEFTTVVYAVSTITAVLAVLGAIGIDRFIGLRSVLSS